MVKLRIVVMCLVEIFLVFMLSSCATTTLPLREGWARNYEFLDNTAKEQEKENIKITLTPINDLEINKYAELFQIDVQNWGKEWVTRKKWGGPVQEGKWVKSINFWYPEDHNGNRYANTFIGMPAFFVSIKNSTGHIIRMQDARVYLIVEGIDPIPAIANFGIPTPVQTSLTLYKENENTVIPQSAQIADGSLIDYITRYELELVNWLRQAKNSEPKYRNYPLYPFGLLARTANDNRQEYKLINAVGREILPDFSLNGILCFPIQMEPDQQARVIFYDITTQTDAAGNPIKKTQFEFTFKYKPKYVTFNELARKWEVSASPEISKK